MHTNVNIKIAEFENAQIRYHLREAIKRIETKFEEAVERDDTLAAARSFIEKINLVCGERRMAHIDVSVDRRVS